MALGLCYLCSDSKANPRFVFSGENKLFRALHVPSDYSQFYIFALVCASVHVNIDVEAQHIHDNSPMIVFKCRASIDL